MNLSKRLREDKPENIPDCPCRRRLSQHRGAGAREECVRRIPSAPCQCYFGEEGESQTWGPSSCQMHWFRPRLVLCKVCFGDPQSSEPWERASVLVSAHLLWNARRMALSQGDSKLLSQTNLISFPSRFLQAGLVTPAHLDSVTVAALSRLMPHGCSPGPSGELQMGQGLGPSTSSPPPAPAQSPEAECGVVALDKGQFLSKVVFYPMPLPSSHLGTQVSGKMVWGCLSPCNKSWVSKLHPCLFESIK